MKVGKLYANKNFLYGLFILWNISEFIGATEIFFSNRFSGYLSDQYPDMDNALGAYLGSIPLFYIIIPVIVSILILLFYKLTTYILNKNKIPIMFKYSVLVIWFIGILFAIKSTLLSTFTMIKWRFFLSIIPSVIVVIICVTIIIQFYSIMKKIYS